MRFISRICREATKAQQSRVYHDLMAIVRHSPSWRRMHRPFGTSLLRQILLCSVIITNMIVRA